MSQNLENLKVPIRKLRDERGHFLPGVSGNPGGLAHGQARKIQQLFVERTPEAVRQLWEISQTTANERLKVDILKFWVERAGGKMPQMIAGPDGEGLPPGSQVLVYMPVIEKKEE